MKTALQYARKLLFSDAMTKGDLKRMLYRNQFSSYLPYRAYEEADRTFYNMDGSLGWIYECLPLVYAGSQTFTDLQGLFTAGLPDGAILQFILYTDPNIKNMLDYYKYLKVRPDEIVQEATKRTIDYFQKGTNGFDQMSGIPARNARLFVALKIPMDKNRSRNAELSFRDNIFETLKGANLCPQYTDPDSLIQLLGGILNDDIPEKRPYDILKTINKQIINSDTAIYDDLDKIRIGKKHLRCQTVKKMAVTVEELTMNYLTGDIWGPRSDGNQITTPYLMAVNIIFKQMNAVLHSKTNLVLNQQIAGSVARSLQRKQEEYLWASGELDKGVQFVRIQPIIWHFAETEEQSRETSARIKRIWDSKGFVTQEDRGILKILFLASLPFGLYTQDGAVDFIDRDFICHPEIATKCLPVQCDFMGSGAPHMIFLGRKGQIIPFDIFNKTSNNYNGLICAESGSGKSVLANRLVMESYASGARIRMIDIGGSYKKTCRIVGGKFINFSKDSDICINPFSNIIDILDDIASIAAVVSQMIFSNSKRIPTETEYTIIKAAIRAVYELYGTDGDIDKVYEALKTPSKHMPMFYEMEEACENEENCLIDIKKSSTELAFNLRTFTTEGEYGRWFNGTANLDIANDDFVVLELEELKAQPELFAVVTLQVINLITAGVYLSDRSKKQLITFDEAWQFFGDSALLSIVIEEGYRKARKYFCSFFCITQSVMDTQQFGQVGSVIRSNSAYKLYLQSSDVDRASKEGVIDYDPFVLALMKSVKSPKPRYSEIFLDGPNGKGVMRLALDPFSRWLYSSDAEDNLKIEKLVKTGMTYTEAIKTLIEGE